MKRSAVYLAIICTVFCAKVAQAIPIQFAFGGTVTQTSFDPSDPFSGTIQLGTPIRGIYVFESTITNAIPSPANADLGSYSVSGLPYRMTVNIGGNTFSTSDLNVGVANNIGSGVDQYTVLGQQGISGGLSDLLTLELFLQDDQGTAFNSTDLPLAAPDLSRLEVRQFRLDALRTISNTLYQYEIQGSVATLVYVPEPGMIPLLIAGLMGLTLRYRSRSGGTSFRRKFGCVPR